MIRAGGPTHGVSGSAEGAEAYREVCGMYYQLLARVQMWKWDRDERGATAVEYGLMVAAIAAVIVTIVIAVGGEVKAGFTDVDTELKGI